MYDVIAVSSYFSAEEIGSERGRDLPKITQPEQRGVWIRSPLWLIPESSLSPPDHSLLVITRIFRYGTAYLEDSHFAGQQNACLPSQELKEDCHSAQTRHICWKSNPEKLILRNKKTWVTIQNNKKKHGVLLMPKQMSGLSFDHRTWEGDVLLQVEMSGEKWASLIY